MAKVVKIKSPVTIRYKQLANGNQSVYLDIYRDGKRIYKFLKLYIVPGKDPASRANNENVMRAAVAAQAQVIRDIARIREASSNGYVVGYKISKERTT